jgi:farnesyl diphosphate synthase
MKQIVNDLIARHEHVLHRILESTDIPAAQIREAISYVLFPGGKRLRPLLVYLCGDLIDVDLEILDSIAAAIEFTHCYSLVHDDLPAMDNDDLRRGKPSCHKAFDEATAILVGDGMQILAVDILLEHLADTLPATQVIKVTRELVKASGPAGMISGQSLDLSELAKPSISEATLRNIHLLKTGRLISACAKMVICAGNPSPPEANALEQFAYHLGLVFQMQDDYLDKYNEATLGKGRASDEANRKTTFATLYGQEELLQLITEHFCEAQKALMVFGDRASVLRKFIHQLQRRSDGIIVRL